MTTVLPASTMFQPTTMNTYYCNQHRPINADRIQQTYGCKRQVCSVDGCQLATYVNTPIKNNSKFVCSIDCKMRPTHYSLENGIKKYYCHVHKQKDSLMISK